MTSNKTIRAMLKATKYQKFNMNVYNLPLTLNCSLNNRTFPMGKNGLEELKNAIQVVDSNRDNEWTLKDVNNVGSMTISNDGDKGILIKVNGCGIKTECNVEYYTLITCIDRAIGDRDHNRKLFNLLFKEKQFSIVKESYYQNTNAEIEADYILTIGKSNAEYWTSGCDYVLAGTETNGGTYLCKSGKASKQHPIQPDYDKIISRCIRLDVLCEMLGTNIIDIIKKNHAEALADSRRRNMVALYGDTKTHPHINHAFASSMQTAEMLRVITKAMALI